MKSFSIQIVDNEKNAVVVKADTDCIIGAFSEENDPEKRCTKNQLVVMSNCSLPELASVINGAEKAVMEAKKSVVHKAAPSMLEKMLEDLFS